MSSLCSSLRVDTVHFPSVSKSRLYTLQNLNNGFRITEDNYSAETKSNVDVAVTHAHWWGSQGQAPVIISVFQLPSSPALVPQSRGQSGVRWPFPMPPAHAWAAASPLALEPVLYSQRGALVRGDGDLWQNHTEQLSLHGRMSSTLDLSLGFIFT